ncbi:MAG: T9SS type A sorting domain-containing protein [Bacteroidetes bacterium]|nr:T9SS type A sorting domain-containing protein [Bacteroidota bacterium]
MKRVFTLLTVLSFSTLTFAQTMGIVGHFTNWGADPDIVMTSSDGVLWEASSVVLGVDGGLKFRLDSDWANNWGGVGFPTGTAEPGGFGNDIPGLAGTYDVTFNTQTLEYAFTAVATGFDEIGITGGFNSYSSVVSLATLDGTDYFKDDFFFGEPNVLFKRTAPTETLWGGTAFPAGTAVANSNDIPLTVGYYNVSFNKTTLAYNFEQVPVGLIGSAIPPFDWSVDVPMISTDGGITHYLYNFTIGDGVAKFRANGGWAVNWGGPADFPADTAFLNGPDIAVAAGTYDTISFNRYTGQFNFGGGVSPGLGINELEKINASAFPVPAEDIITFVADADGFEVEITDLTGKVVMKTASNTVNISTLNAGTYLYKLTSGNRIGSGKLIKK